MGLGLAAIAAEVGLGLAVLAVGSCEALEVATSLAWGAAAASLLIAVAAELPELLVPEILVLTPCTYPFGGGGMEGDSVGDSGVVGACKRTAATRSVSVSSVLHQASSSSSSASAASRRDLFIAKANDRRAKCCLSHIQAHGKTKNVYSKKDIYDCNTRAMVAVQPTSDGRYETRNTVLRTLQRESLHKKLLSRHNPRMRSHACIQCHFSKTLPITDLPLHPSFKLAANKLT